MIGFNATNTVMADLRHGTATEVTFVDQKWQKVTMKVNFVDQKNSRWVSLGQSSERERLFFDSNSEVMKNIKNLARNRCTGQNIREILETVNLIVNSLTYKKDQSPQLVEASLNGKVDQYLMQTGKSSQGHIDIFMDDLIQRGLLICRHKALIAASILADLVDNEILPAGIVRQYRAKIGPSSAHSWALYRNSNDAQLWMCDPRWNVVSRVYGHEGELSLKGYSYCLNQMVVRSDSLDILNEFCEKVKPARHALANIVRDVAINEGTLATPYAHVRIQLNGKAQGEALIVALQKQGIQSQLCFNGTHFLILRVANNPKMMHLKFGEFLHDCLMEQNRTPAAPLMINEPSAPAAKEPAVPAVKEPVAPVVNEPAAPAVQEQAAPLNLAMYHLAINRKQRNLQAIDDELQGLNQLRHEMPEIEALILEKQEQKQQVEASIHRLKARK